MENAILDRVKTQTRNLQRLTEELQVQMALGKAEAKDLVEKEKKNISHFINAQRRQINEMESASLEHRRNFLSHVENLETTLNQDTPINSASYDNYKAELLNRIYAVEDIVKTNYPKMTWQMQEKMDVFKAKMDAFRVNLALNDKSDPEKVNRIRGEFNNKVTEVRTLLGKQENAQTKLDSFVEDISESFKYLKRAIADLSN